MERELTRRLGVHFEAHKTHLKSNIYQLPARETSLGRAWVPHSSWLAFKIVQVVVGEEYVGVNSKVRM